MNEQIGYSLDPDTTASYCPFHSSEKKEKKWVRISWMDANIIRKPQSAALWAGLPARTMALLAGKHTCQGNNKERKGWERCFLIWFMSSASLLRFLRRGDGDHILLSKTWV
jgi:hypothetical protein